MAEPTSPLDSPTSPGGTSSDQSQESVLHRLDMSSFKKRNSAILRDLEAQEEERQTLWAALQQARLDGERLRQEELAVSKEDETAKTLLATPVDGNTQELEERAPTSAELMAMLSADAMLSATPKEPVPTPTRFTSRRPGRRSAFPPNDEVDRRREERVEHPAVLASGFICPTCWMRAPSAEVLRRHDEEVHQTPFERATNRVLDNSGPLGTMTRVAYRKIRRSLSVRPQTISERPDDSTLLAETRQASFRPASSNRAGRRYSMPPAPTEENNSQDSQQPRGSETPLQKRAARKLEPSIVYARDIFFTQATSRAGSARKSFDMRHQADDSTPLAN